MRVREQSGEKEKWRNKRKSVITTKTTKKEIKKGEMAESE